MMSKSNVDSSSLLFKDHPECDIDMAYSLLMFARLYVANQDMQPETDYIFRERITETYGIKCHNVHK